MPRYLQTRNNRNRYNPYGSMVSPAKRVRLSAPAVAVRRRFRRRRYRNFRTGGLIGRETKYSDLNFSGAISATANMSGAECDPATILCLNGVPQGDAMYERDGQKISMKSIFVNGIINIPSQSAQSAAENDATYFIALVLDTQTNGAQLNSEDVYYNDRSGTDAFLLASPLRNIEFTERFKVLQTRQIRVPPPPIAALTAAGNTLVQQGIKIPFMLKKNLKGLMTKFNSTAATGAIGTILDNSLHIVAFCNNADFAGSLIYQSRLRFWDH